MNNTLTNEMNEVPRRTVTGRVDLYRDIHKGLRHELFDLTFRAGRLDPADDALVIELVAESRKVIRLLRDHHSHEEQPAFEQIVEAHVPAVARVLHDDHHALAERLEWLASRADELAAAPAAARPAIAHAHYLELAAFTSAYLGHLDVEERVVMPAIAAACDDSEIDAVHGSGARQCPARDASRRHGRDAPALAPAERAELVEKVALYRAPRSVRRHPGDRRRCAQPRRVHPARDHAMSGLGRHSSRFAVALVAGAAVIAARRQ